MSKTIKEKNNNEYYQKLQDIKKPLIYQTFLGLWMMWQSLHNNKLIQIVSNIKKINVF